MLSWRRSFHLSRSEAGAVAPTGRSRILYRALVCLTNGPTIRPGFLRRTTAIPTARCSEGHFVTVTIVGEYFSVPEVFEVQQTLAWRVDSAGASAWSLAPFREGNRLYLDKLIRVTENSDAKQCAGWVMVSETASDLIPRHNQIVSTAGGHEDGRLEHVTYPSATFLQDNPQVVERPARLCSDITRSDDLALIINRARTRGNNQASLSSRGGVCIRHARKQPGTAYKFCCHANKSGIVLESLSS